MDGEPQQLMSGTVVSIGLMNFMQYDHVKFYVGSRLNVIIGPNGSGKSSIVNAIVLGLCGKVESLGPRTKNLNQFIRNGKEIAKIEIELHNSSGQNWTITRQISQDNKSQWRLNGSRSTEHAIKSLVCDKLNIQTDNLCQFLPQDKVHEFSKLTPKQLLSKTIDAVGKVELKEDHKRLLDIQNELNNTRFSEKAQLDKLEDLKRNACQMESELESFHEKKRLTDRINLFEKRRDWLLFEEQKRVVKDLIASLDVSRRQFSKTEKQKFLPLKNKMDKEVKVERENLNNKIKSLVSQIRDAVGEAKKYSDKIEDFQDQIEKVDNEVTQVEFKHQEEKKKEQLMKNEIDVLQNTIDDLEKDSNDNETTTLLNQLRTSFEQTSSQKESENQKSAEITRDAKQCEYQIRSLHQKLSQISNAEKLKENMLFQNVGKDVAQAYVWIKNNRNLFSGHIYDPILLMLKVDDKSLIPYVENSIAGRDLLAFGASSVQDMNEFNRHMRSKGWHVNAFHAPDITKHQLSQMVGSSQSKQSSQSFKSQRQFDFKGYVSDLFHAPDPIMYHLCKLSRLQSIPVFGRSAEPFLQKFVSEYGLSSFYVGATRHICSRSKYSGNTSTRSFGINTHKLLIDVFSNVEDENLDASNEIKSKIEVLTGDLERHRTELKSLHSVIEELTRKEENLRREQKEIRDKLGHVRNQKARLAHKIKMFESYKGNRDNNNSNQSIEDVKDMLLDKKRELCKDCIHVKYGLLGDVIVRNNKIKIRLEVEKIKLMRVMDCEEQVAGQLTDIQNEMREARSKIEKQENDLKYASNELKDVLLKVLPSIDNNKRRSLTASSLSSSSVKCPEELSEKFEEEKVPGCLEAIDTSVCEMKGELECMDDVSHDIIQRYGDVKEQINEVEIYVSNIQQRNTDKSKEIEDLRNRWITSVDDMISKISSFFSSYFETIGFVGDICLSKPSNPENHSDYGIDILVKFRSDSSPLTRLDGFSQSGGERSVSTALYMMAIQEMSVVPFRCVDEINQGMDAVNERRVFDILVERSCSNDLSSSASSSSSQYFLLTPKLLPDLKYHVNMNLLNVNNGPEMCSFQEWNIDSFIACAE